MRRLGHVPALDGLRGIAILLVLVCHLGIWWPGGRGVDLFFVLSGFLITTLLFEERQRFGRISLRGFYTRRARRLFPALGLLLSGYLVIEAVRGYDALGQVARYGLYLGNFFAVYGPQRTGGDGLTQDGLAHLWSLATEEQYYLVWPIVLIAITRTWRPLLLISLITLAGLGSRLFFALQQHPNLQALYYLPTGHSQGLLVGSLFAAWRIQRGLAVSQRAALVWVAVGGLAIYATSAGLTPGFFAWQLTLFEVACAMVVLAAVDQDSRFARALSLRPLVWIGKISYSLYLWHFVWLQLFDGRLPIVALALSFSSAAASYYLVEQRFRRRRDSSRREKIATVAAPA